MYHGLQRAQVMTVAFFGHKMTGSANRKDNRDMESSMIVLIMDDLFFLTKIQTTLHHLGLTSKTLTTQAQLLNAWQSATAPTGVVVDLTLRAANAVDLIRALRSTSESGKSIPILAFGSHVEVEQRRQALAAGADHVVTKSELSKHLPELLQRLVGSQIEREKNENYT